MDIPLLVQDPRQCPRPRSEISEILHCLKSKEEGGSGLARVKEGSLLIQDYIEADLSNVELLAISSKEEQKALFLFGGSLMLLGKHMPGGATCV